MADLITQADLAKYPTQVDLNTPLTEVLISSASESVIEAAGSPILEQRSEVELPAMPKKILALPGLPIRTVHSVAVDGVPVIGYRRITAGLYLESGWSPRGIDMVTVDYTHGLTAVPADIKDLVARMVLAGLIAAQDGAEGLALHNGQRSSVAIDDYKEAFATGDDVEAVTEMTLPQRTRDWLSKRFGAGPSVRGQL